MLLRRNTVTFYFSLCRGVKVQVPWRTPLTSPLTWWLSSSFLLQESPALISLWPIHHTLLLLEVIRIIWINYSKPLNYSWVGVEWRPELLSCRLSSFSSHYWWVVVKHFNSATLFSFYLVSCSQILWFSLVLLAHCLNSCDRSCFEMFLK